MVVGVSTGGPNALAEMLGKFPADLGVPVLIVQHMPPTFTKLLAERLDKECAIHVVEAEDGMKAEAGTVYIAPGDYHMVVSGRGSDLKIATHQQEKVNSCRPSVDVLFDSATNCLGGSLLGVVMTGMGSDGVAGSSKIHGLGGQIIVQDQASSVVWGMAGGVAGSGVADAVLPLDGLATQIIERVRRGSLLGKS